MKLKGEYLQAVSFNNVPHFHNFMNYLLRTDEKQRWTNELTKVNMYCFKSEEGEMFFFGYFDSLTNRKDLKGKLYKILMPKIRNSGVGVLANDIMYYSFDGIENATTENLKSSFIDIIKYSKKNIRDSVFILHVDQDKLHVHSVFSKTNIDYKDW